MTEKKKRRSAGIHFFHFQKKTFKAEGEIEKEKEEIQREEPQEKNFREMQQQEEKYPVVPNLEKKKS